MYDDCNANLWNDSIYILPGFGCRVTITNYKYKRYFRNMGAGIQHRKRRNDFIYVYPDGSAVCKCSPGKHHHNSACNTDLQCNRAILLGNRRAYIADDINKRYKRNMVAINCQQYYRRNLYFYTCSRAMCLRDAHHYYNYG